MNQTDAKPLIGQEIPRIIHFSIPTALPLGNGDCIAAVKRLHPDWEIKLWKDPLDPAGFRLAHLWQSTTSQEHLSDLIRLEVVHRYGGFYINNNFDFHKSLEPFRSNSFVICSEDGEVLTNAFFGATRSNPILELLISQLQKLADLPSDTTPRLSTGPAFLARLLHWKSEITVVPRELFYPYLWNEQPIRPSVAGIATHLWEGTCAKSATKKKSLRQVLKNTAKPLARKLAKRIENISGSSAIYAMTEEVMIRTPHGYNIIASGRDLSVTPHLAKDGFYERDDELFIKSIVKGGDWCVDVGANIGVFSLLFASLVGPFGRVFAFEPNPITIKYLQRSVISNWFHDRLRVNCAAVGSSNGTETIYFSQDRLGDSVVGASTEHQKRSHDYAGLAIEAANVELVSLDQFFPEWSILTCLKVDAEGHEPEVLRGAQRLFDEGRVSCLIIECLQELGVEYFDDLTCELRRLNKIGYVCGFSNSDGEFVSQSLDQFIQAQSQRNLIFIHASYLDRLKN